MGKSKVVLLVLLGFALVIGIILAIFNFVVPKGAGILVDTSPASAVFINGEEAGRTPYSSVRKPGEITVKLIPDSFGQPLLPYETKTTLVSGVQTVIRRQFGPSDDLSQGELVSFEKVAKNETGMAVITTPENSQISIDGQVRGFSPSNINSIGEGEHSLSVSGNGYATRSIQIKTLSGYKLIALVKLAVVNDTAVGGNTNQAEDQGSGSSQKTMIKILSTPVGYLRVRSEPSTIANEIGQVKPDETYELVETDSKTGWYKIIISDGKEGWITNQYAEKSEGESSAGKITPTLTPAVKPTKTPTIEE